MKTKDKKKQSVNKMSTENKSIFEFDIEPIEFDIEPIEFDF